MELVLHEQRPEAGDAVSFVFERPAGLDWKPGQYLGLRVEHADPDARGVTRTFTIASASEENVRVAGPQVMVHGVTGLLAMTGVPAERVRTEAFPGY